MLTWKDTQEAVVGSKKAPHRSARVELRLAERDAAAGRSGSERHRAGPQSVSLTRQRSLISRSDQSASGHEGKTFIVGFALMSGLTPVMIRRCQRQSSANQQRPSATGDHNTGALILLSGFVVAAAGGAPSRSSSG